MKTAMTEWENRLRELLSDACDHYEKTAPTVHSYCDNLYVRLNEKPLEVSLYELRKVVFLRENDTWLQPNAAASFVYHLMKECGQDTTGHAGF